MSSSKKNIPCSLTFSISAISLTLSAIMTLPGCGNSDTSPDTNLDASLDTRSEPKSPSTKNNQITVTNQITEDQQIAAFSNSNYTYEDVVLLAKFWNETPTAWEAKLKIGFSLLQGNNTLIQQALKKAKNNQIPVTNQSTEDQQVEAFFDSNYTYDDAVLLARFWAKATPWEAKLKIGFSLLQGDDTLIQQTLKKEQQRAAFSNSNYTYDDAVLLAKFWNDTPTEWEAKLKIGKFLLKGDNTLIQQALTQAKNNQISVTNQSTEDQQMTAFSNSSYTYEDAVLLAEFWGKATPWEAKLKMGSFLIKNDNKSIEQALKHFLG